MSTYCRECGGELDVIRQPGYAPAGTPDRTYVTCWNEPDCPLGGQTLDADGYAERDLTAYIRSWETKTGRVWQPLPLSIA